MTWRRLSIVLGMLTILVRASCAMQEPSLAPQFFAGVVTHADTKRISVSRTLVGRSPETHAFVIDGKTKMPKNGIKPRMRVTVRYEHRAEDDLAIEIQIRPADSLTKAP